MPRPRNQNETEDSEVYGGPASTPIAYPPGEEPEEERGPQIEAPSRWNSDLWGNDPGDEGGVVYDRPDYTDGPYGPPISPPGADDEEDSGDDGGSGWSKKPRHMQIYGGRGYNEDGSLRDPAAAGGSGSGSGSSGGAAASKPSSGSGSSGYGNATMDALQQSILDTINGVLSGKDVPFDDKTISRLKDQAFAATSGRVGAAQDTLNQDLIRRGVFRSGIAAQNQQDLQRAGIQQYGQSATQIDIDARQANYEARMAGLDRAEKDLDRQQQYVLQKEMNEIDREKALATIKLGYARIASEEKQLKMSLDAKGKGGGGGGYDPVDALIAQYFAGQSSAPQNPFG